MVGGPSFRCFEPTRIWDDMFYFLQWSLGHFQSLAVKMFWHVEESESHSFYKSFDMLNLAHHMTFTSFFWFWTVYFLLKYQVQIFSFLCFSVAHLSRLTSAVQTVFWLSPPTCHARVTQVKVKNAPKEIVTTKYLISDSNFNVCPFSGVLEPFPTWCIMKGFLWRKSLWQAAIRSKKI